MSDKSKGLYTGDVDFDELLDKCMRIIKTKAVDYAEEDDRLAEFRQTAEMIGVNMKTVLGIYINKHLRSLFKWLRGTELKGEPIEEKLTDIIIYCLLAYKVAKEERHTKIDQSNTEVIQRQAAICLCDSCGREMTVIYNEKDGVSIETWRDTLKTSMTICDPCQLDQLRLNNEKF